MSVDDMKQVLTLIDMDFPDDEFHLFLLRANSAEIIDTLINTLVQHP